MRAETRHKSPKVRSELGDWSLISNLSLWQWKKKTQSSFVSEERLICCSRAPELRDTPTTESRDFKSSQCPPPPASETAGRTHQALFSVRSHPCVSVVPTNHHYSEHQNPLHALFGKKVLCNDWHETKIWKFFICLSNTLQELQSGDFRGSFSFFQLWLQHMSCMLTLKPNLNGRKSEWRRNRKWREGGKEAIKIDYRYVLPCCC